MAEPLGLVASLVTLIQAVNVGGKALVKLKSCYNAPPEIARIQTEVERLGKLLQNVEDFVKVNSVRWTNDGLAESVTLAASRIASINKILTSSAFGIKRLSDANKARTTILRYKARLVGLENQLRESIQEICLHLCLAIA